jgi:hypothetical protein
MTPSERVPRLIALIDGVRVEAPLDREPAGAGAVNETSFVELLVAPAEPDTSYRIRIGSEPVESAEGDGVGEAAVDLCIWPASTPFESARGRTFLRVESRAPSSDWRTRGGLIANVTPSKLGEARYGALFDELRAVSSALVYDVTGKSARVLHASAMGAIEQEWRRAQRVLHAITRTCGALTVRAAAPAGARRHRLASLRDPAQRADVRAIAGGLELLARRADGMRVAAADALDEIRRGRVDTDVHVGRDRVSLYDIREAPRVRRLEDVASRAAAIAASIRRARELEPFARARPLAARLGPAHAGARASGRAASGRPRTGVASMGRRAGTPHGDAFDALRRTARVIRAVEGGSYRRPTSALYESWVYLRLVRAFSTLARSAAPLQELLDSLGQRRLGSAIPAGTTATFALHDGRGVVLTFEPFVRSRRLALEQGDALFREDDVAAPLTPDVMIVLRRERIERVAIVDAKYIARPRPDLWRRLARYSGIRHTATGRSAAADVWLAAPIGTDAADVACVPDAWRGGLLPLVPGSARPTPILRGDGPPITFAGPTRAGSRGRHHAAERDGAAVTAAAFARSFTSGS